MPQKEPAIKTSHCRVPHSRPSSLIIPIRRGPAELPIVLFLHVGVDSDRLRTMLGSRRSAIAFCWASPPQTGRAGPDNRRRELLDKGSAVRARLFGGRHGRQGSISLSQAPFPVDLWLDLETCGGQDQTRPGASESMLCDYEEITPRLAPTWVGFVTVAPLRSDMPHSSALAQTYRPDKVRKRHDHAEARNPIPSKIPHNLRQPRCVTVLPRRRSRPGSVGQGRREASARTACMHVVAMTTKTRRHGDTAAASTSLHKAPGRYPRDTTRETSVQPASPCSTIPRLRGVSETSDFDEASQETQEMLGPLKTMG